MTPHSTFTALVLAGTRPGGDPLSISAGVSHKALLPIAGQPMILRVLRSLACARAVGRLAVCGFDRERLEQVPEARHLLDSGRVSFIPGRSSPSASVLEAVRTIPEATPMLVTTADHPLLTPQILDFFCDAAVAAAADVAVGLVEAATVRAAYPGSRRTFLRFREGGYCGSNLFALLTPSSDQAAAAWIRVEQYRKHPWRIISALGPVATLRFLLRRLTLDETLTLAAREMGIRVAKVLLPHADAAVDVDNPRDRELVESILAAREGAPGGSMD